MQDGKWTADSNECLEIILASGSDESSDLSFSPSFTHSIFDEETIFGYANLSIKLLFSAGSLRQCLSISYDDKHNKADDVEGTLYEFLAADYSKDVDQFRKSILDDDFCPTGTRIASYVLDRKGKQTELDIKPGNHDFDEAEVVYEAYASDWQTKGAYACSQAVRFGGDKLTQSRVVERMDRLAQTNADIQSAVDRWGVRH